MIGASCDGPLGLGNLLCPPLLGRRSFLAWPRLAFLRPLARPKCRNSSGGPEARPTQPDYFPVSSAGLAGADWFISHVQAATSPLSRKRSVYSDTTLSLALSRR